MISADQHENAALAAIQNSDIDTPAAALEEAKVRALLAVAASIEALAQVVRVNRDPGR